MNSFLSEITRLVIMPAGDQSSTPEIAAIWVLAVIAHSIAVIVTGKCVQSSLAYSIPRAMLISLLNISALILSLACCNIYIMPHMGNASLRGIAPAIMLIAAITGIAALACRFIHRTKYSKAMVTLVVSVACAVGAAYITKSAFTAGRRAKASATEMKHRTENSGTIPK